MFAVEARTGELTVLRSLDREEVPAYNVTVVARDGGKPPRTASLPISLQILDTNDNNPVFYPVQYFVVLQSDFRQEEAVVQLRATDRDMGGNAVLEYELLEGDSSVFSLDRQTGRVELVQPVAALPVSRYSLLVGARDRPGREAAEPARLEILIETDQLRYLTCTEDLYRFSIAEDSALEDGATAGRAVGRVRLAEPLQDAQFEIIDGNELDSFEIDAATGQISSSRPLDREQEETTVLKIRVKSEVETVSAICLAEVRVEDVNDETPRILGPGLITVKEDAPIKEVIAVVRAADGDHGDNARLQFSLVSSEPAGQFSIQEESGAVVLERSVRGARARSFTVAARDSGNPPLAATKTFTVEVEDVNDHTPLFDLSEFDISIPENAQVNSKLFWLRATDADLGAAGRVDYTITAGDNQTFAIFPDGQLYLQRRLDRETTDLYLLGVTARDGGQPSRSSTVRMTVRVTDRNDNPPVFSQPSYSFTIAENEPARTFVGQVAATDRDIGRNSELSYAAATDNPYFSVHPRTGFVVSTASLDREALVEELGTDEIRLDVVVRDGGATRLSATATVTIAVQDENDNEPEFSVGHSVARVSEGAGPGREVAVVAARDPDRGTAGTLLYSLTSGNRAGLFRVNASSGLVVLTGQLDRETTARYQLGVTATDGGGQSATTTLDILVEDENDNAPELVGGVRELSLPEDTPVGARVMQFTARDADEGENAELRWSVRGPAARHFSIDPYTGAVELQAPLDYESEEVLRLKVVVTDRGAPPLENTTRLTVTVTDVNDNAPEFPQRAVVRQVQEGLAPGSTVLKLEATDRDSGDNGRVEFSLAGTEAGPAGRFVIDPRSGELRTAGPVDREETDTFRLTVVATDLAVPPAARLSAEKEVTIIVEDINDNAPEFVRVEVGLVTPSTQPGDLILTVQATDPDSNSAGLVSYSLAEESFLFSIDHRSGKMTLRNMPETLLPRFVTINEINYLTTK